MQKYPTPTPLTKASPFWVLAWWSQVLREAAFWKYNSLDAVSESRWLAGKYNRVSPRGLHLTGGSSPARRHALYRSSHPYPYSEIHKWTQDVSERNTCLLPLFSITVKPEWNFQVNLGLPTTVETDSFHCQHIFKLNMRMYIWLWNCSLFLEIAANADLNLRAAGFAVTPSTTVPHEDPSDTLFKAEFQLKKMPLR